MSSPARTSEPGRGIYRPDIDGLRAIAIASVVAFHAFPELVAGGFVGVDVFFVISGYLISSIVLRALERSTFSFAEFYARRIRRLLPSLCIVLAAVLAGGWYRLLPDEFSALGQHVLAGIGFVSNLLLWRESGYFDASADAKPLLHLWSLGIEEQFYLIWPLLLWFAWKRGLNSFRISIVVAVAAFVANVCLVQRAPVATFYLPITRFWEILAGSLLAQMHVRGLLASDVGAHGDHRADAMAKNLLAGCGIALLLIAITVLDKHSPFPGWWALLPVVGTALLIAAGPAAWINRHLLANPLMVWIGLISYPLYLWHWPLLVFVRLADEQPPGVPARFGVVVAAVVLAWLTYVLVDRPIRHGPYARSKVLITCTVAVLLALVGQTIYRLHGIPSRFAGDVARLANFTYNYRAEYREGTCFLRPEQDASAFGECSSSLPHAGAKSVVLWGDSHAAHLYPGLKVALEPNDRLTQLTASLCPPIIGVDVSGREHCRAINDYVLQRVLKERPDRVILAALWTGGSDSTLVNTIRALHEHGIRDIELIGPVPRWQASLPRAMYLYSQQDPWHRVPRRMLSGLISTADIEARMRKLAETEQVTYVSILDILCDAQGCLTQTDDRSGAPIDWDSAHLTAAGSRFVVARFPASVLAP